MIIVVLSPAYNVVSMVAACQQHVEACMTALGPLLTPGGRSPFKSVRESARFSRHASCLKLHRPLI